MMRIARAIVLAALLIAAGPAHAHKPSDSYLALTIEGDSVRGQWDIALRDLDYAIGLDGDDDGAITWNELRAREPAIAAYALARLRLSGGGRDCVLQPDALLADRHSDGAYAVLPFTARCAAGTAGTADLTADYRLFFDLDPQHRGLTRYTANGVTRTAIFSPDRAAQRLGGDEASAARGFVSFVREGIGHIWIGIDHLLFLLALLLPAMLVRTRAGWQPVAKLPAALWDVFRTVTAFTVAHSITLTAAALGFVALPSRWVETAIACSVLFAALNNVYPVVRKRLWLVAFAFGLVHGFGFASVLLDLGLPRDALALSLFGFNLGVEIGQLAVVALYFTAAYALRSTRIYRGVVMTGGSAAIAFVAMIWMLERALDLKLLPF